MFYALLVSSLALAIGASIFDITLREIDLSNAATQSQYAVYVADSGAECALYWDSKYSGNGGSAFATSSADGQFATSGVVCNGVDVAAAAVAATPTTWPQSTTASAATTTFTIAGVPIVKNGQTIQTPCALVSISKLGNPSVTTVTSHGYNTCVAGPLQLERVFQVSY